MDGLPLKYLDPLVFRLLLIKPPVQFSGTTSDPDMVHNLAGDPQYAGVLKRMRKRLEDFQKDIPDLAEFSERELIDRGILTDRLEEYRQRLASLPEAFALGDHRMPVLEMPLDA